MSNCIKVRSLLLVASALLFFPTLSPLTATAGGEQPAVIVTKESTITISAENQPLNGILRMMAEKRLFTVRGAVGNEGFTAHLSNVTLQEALSKLLRGYNYVMIGQGSGQIPVLSVMGKVRADSGGAGRATGPAPAPAEPNSYVPPAPSETPPQAQHRPPPASARATPNGPPPNEAAGETGQMVSPAPPPQAPPGGSARNLLNGQPGGQAQQPGEAQPAQPGSQTPQQAGQQPGEASPQQAEEHSGVQF